MPGLLSRWWSIPRQTERMIKAAANEIPKYWWMAIKSAGNAASMDLFQNHPAKTVGV